jgi:hypothetical protein
MGCALSLGCITLGCGMCKRAPLGQAQLQEQPSKGNSKSTMGQQQRET